MSKVSVLLVAVLVLLAGCTGASPTGTPDSGEDETTVVSEEETATQSETRTETETATATPEPTATATPEPEIENPWGQSIVVVGIDQTVNPDRNVTPLVRQALEYWENNSEQYGSYSIDYRLVPDRRQPDIEIQFVDDIADCGPDYTVDTVGCAPVIDPDAEADLSTPVQVEAGYNNNSTLLILKHELGHTLGLEHSSTPSFMTESDFHYTLPKPDVTDRYYPWKTSNFTVYVDDSNVSEFNQDEYREQIEHAVTYYEDDPKGMPSNLSFTFVDDRANATLVVTYRDDVDDPKSSVRTYGYDPDGDDALEYYTDATIYIEDLEHDRVAYHVGYWIGMITVADDRSDLPPPLQEDGANPEDHWWD
ncbi:Matrixin [Halogranum gelatinilyticum]|uniref:Matrixin n=1 Tax=Halogranum gelatinilyticum TaxID=660521 RepID=A0A1H0A3H9_9EURY|nr:matrixin family metalloprotease [Halogranum gelatinilyticum]SDN27965.1 Matrixin [Halogranum gelatinilyticum]